MMLFPPQISEQPRSDLALVVVIPAYRENELLRSLQSLKDNEPTQGSVEVIVVINGNENDDEATRIFHQQSFQETQTWAAVNSTDDLRFFTLYHPQLPAKKAGVGLARKIGMDEAVCRLEKSGNPQGVVACFDADSTCASNYLAAVEFFFREQPKAPACSIDFAHPLEGTEYSPEIYQAITEYELHLRYYIQAQRWAGFPLAYHTVGSSMAVRADAYQQQGGMNSRKAGEDFYFLHKFIPLDHFGELHTTTVFPSPRMSDRVPFGTGKSVKELLGQKQGCLTYAPAIFEDLKPFLSEISTFYKAKDLEVSLNLLPKSIQHFLSEIGVEEKLREIQQNTSSIAAFIKRFYHWFNAFQLMKYVHFARDHYYSNVPVEEAANYLLQQITNEKEIKNSKECLLVFREIQRESF